MTGGAILVVGGGVLGWAIAGELARAGRTVRVVAPEGDARTASVGSLAWLNASTATDPGYVRLRRAALAGWRDWAEAGAPVRFGGSLFWGSDASDTMAARLGALGCPVARLDRAGIAAVAPGLRHPPETGLFVSDEGCADPALILPWLRTRAEAAGAMHLRGQAAALGPGALRLDDGTTLDADHIVMAAGEGASALLATAGLDLRVAGKPGLLIRTTPGRPVSDAVFATPSYDFWQRDDGAFLIASSSATGTGDADDMIAAEATAHISKLFGQTDLRVAERIARTRPIPADGLPLLGRWPGRDDLSVAVTHSGLTLAPIVAACIAAPLIGRDMPHDIAHLRPDRALQGA
ncbi:FAD-binding oxidoreductase [uncultured Jannaschia sp.]|uniref:NAD(P)/FAD-dependent oxidoreductase n=1 Tax=uncultured Jannaschia sp. TaxID=293347 RepID=UPI002639A94A|nr:FAD-dependent oxidoreductase [uncultured Jannaschia sp.]